jgi:hypothetical protein
MRSLFASAALAAALLVSTPAHAQFVGQPGGVAVPLFGVHLFGMYEFETKTAVKSFDAVLPTSSGSTPRLFGAGVEVQRVWKGAFGRFTATHTSNDGTRVFVDASKKVHPLNVPLTIGMTPIEVGGGWRFGDGRRSAGARRRFSMVPYVGAALLFQKYSETSPAASASENIDATDKGSSIFAGLDLGIGMVHVGVEGFLRSVPDAIGADGVSLEFNEDNLGGKGLRLLFGISF